MKRLALAACVACVVFVMAAAAFGSSVVVESKTVRGPSSVGVYLQNSETIRYIYIPLVIRQLESYPIALEGEFVESARLENYLTFIWYLNYYDHENGTCKDGQPGGFGTISNPGSASGARAVSVPSPSNPDAFAFVRSYGMGLPLFPGSDGAPPDGNPSIRINFTLPPDCAEGSRFVIDSTCTDPYNHLLFIRESGHQPVPDLTFTPGTITCLPCNCPYQGDGDEDGFITVLDLQIIGRILFRGEDDVTDPECPTSRFDLDCDGFVTALDLTVLIDHLFVNGPPPCDPCGP